MGPEDELFGEHGAEHDRRAVLEAAIAHYGRPELEADFFVPPPHPSPTEHERGPLEDHGRIVDLAWCMLMAALIAVLVVAIRHLAHRIAAQRVLGPAGLLAAAGLAVGVLAVLFRATADRPVDLVLFSGQAELPAVVAESSAWVLGLVVLAKGLAYALSLGAGFRGGPVFPAIAIGVAAAVAAADVFPDLHTTPAVATGIAAGTTAVLRVPFTAVLLVALLTGPSAFDVAPIAVLAAAVAWLVAVGLPTPEDRAQRRLAQAAGQPGAG